MNLQRGSKLEPLRVLVVNPLSAPTQLVVVKVLTGYVFGHQQLIDVILLVYSNELDTAERLKLELEKCAFPCINSIKVSTDLPRVSDADVFCFMTNFKNPNVFNIESINDDKQFDALYLIIKIANSLHGSAKEAKPDETSEKYAKFKRKNILPEKKAHKPIFLADGLVALDILMSLSHNLPADIFFCPSPLEVIIESVLADHLKVKCHELNDVLIWAADDEVFHAEFKKPLVLHDKIDDAPCSWDMISKDLLESANLDCTQFTASWLKKELMEKSLASSRKNPYGCIYKASAFAKTLKDIWTMRSCNERKFYTNMGVISDGSLETIKVLVLLGPLRIEPLIACPLISGCAYVLPVIFTGDTWTVNTRFHDDFHVKQEIKRINKTRQKSHKQLISYCKKFLTENVIYQAFAALDDDESDSFPPCLVDSSRPSLTQSSTELK